MSFGKALHHLGPTIAIDLSAILVLVLGTTKRMSLDRLEIGTSLQHLMHKFSPVQRNIHKVCV